ncbi:hypothetical protein DMUE_4816, partial [Dictyocoela muelleri]
MTEFKKKNDMISNEKRKNLIKKVTEDGFNVKDAAFLVDVNYQAATNVIRLYKKESRVIKKKTGKASNKKITEEINNFVEELIEINPLITILQIREKIENKFSISLSLESIRRIICALKITLKKISYTSTNINSESSKSKRQLYAQNFMNIEDTFVKIFIDESGFNLYLRRTLGRSSRGNPASAIVPSTRGTNISLISAITDNVVLFATTFVGSVNSDKFIIFFDQLIEKCNQKLIFNNCIFILDNAKIHHSHITKNFFNEKRVNVMFLSPYSYMLNPIEFAFSKIKSIVRRSLAGGFNGSFTDLILDSANQLTANDLQGYSRHIRRNCLKAI